MGSFLCGRSSRYAVVAELIGITPEDGQGSAGSEWKECVKGVEKKQEEEKE